MDLFGVAMLGMTTAVGGGMLRDTMLGLTPPTALRDPVQALVAIAVSILVFFVWRRRKAELHNSCLLYTSTYRTDFVVCTYPMPKSRGCQPAFAGFLQINLHIVAAQQVRCV